MRLVGVKLMNFWRYRDETPIPLDDLTVFIGKNDAGKSSALEALGIFFDAQPVRTTTDPLVTANGNRNVPPERDIGPAMLSLAELTCSIHLEWQAMQPHTRSGR